MGNSNGNQHHHHHSHHSNHHNHHSKNSKTQIDPILSNFFKSILDNTQNKADKIFEYFSNSYIIKQILISNATKNDNYDELENNQMKVIFTDMFQATTSSSIFEVYINLLFEPSEHIDYETISSIFENCFYFTMKYMGINADSESFHSKVMLKSVVNSIPALPEFVNQDNKKTSMSLLKDWIINEFPELFYGFHQWFLNKIKQANEDKSNQIELHQDDLSNFMNKATAWYFVCNLPICFTKSLASENGSLIEKLKNCIEQKAWKQLYNSDSHGLSLNRFQSNLANYKAPTIMFIHCYSGALYAVCSGEEYRESPTAYGDDNTRVFRILNDFKIYNLNSTKNIYLNTKSKGLQLGLIIGYSQLKPVLKIDQNFQHIEHELIKNDQIISVEVWGCGSNKASLEQMNQKKWEMKQIEKMRTVKIDAGEWCENADKSLLDMAGIKTEHSERGDF